jgi:guanine deaminase
MDLSGARCVPRLSQRQDASLLNDDRCRTHALGRNYPVGDERLCHTSDIRAPLGRAQVQSETDFMQLAIRLATENVRNGVGGPFGAVVVRNGDVVATGVNRVTADNDPTAHAEVNAIREACKALGTFQLPGCVLYTSCEPCPMCLGAIYWVRLDSVYFGNTCREAAEIGFDDHFIYEELAVPPGRRKLPMVRLLPEKAIESFRAWQEHHTKIAY